MSTLTILIMLASATLAGAVLGGCAVQAWRNLHAPDEIAHLQQRIVTLTHEVEAQRSRAWRAEHRLAFWVGLRDTTVITVDRRRGPE